MPRACVHLSISGYGVKNRMLAVADWRGGGRGRLEHSELYFLHSSLLPSDAIRRHPNSAKAAETRVVDAWFMQQKKFIGLWIRVSTEDQVRGESPEHYERLA